MRKICARGLCALVHRKRCHFLSRESALAAFRSDPARIVGSADAYVQSMLFGGGN